LIVFNFILHLNLASNNGNLLIGPLIQPIETRKYFLGILQLQKITLQNPQVFSLPSIKTIWGSNLF